MGEEVPKYSISVPVYNMIALLPKCIDSLMRQEFEDLEVILVDDCSTDNSFQICLNATKADKRFRAVRQDKNRGLSSTRNLGVQNANGKYVTFVDSDDYVEDNFIMSVDAKERQFQCDMISWGLFNDVVYPDGTIEVAVSNLNYPTEFLAKPAGEEEWTRFIMNTFFASTCLRIYRLDIIRKYGLVFDTECVDFEDYIFNISYCRHIHSFLVMKESFYHYRQPYGQLSTVKRKWGTVVPFDVSDRVFRATETFFRDTGFNHVGTKKVYLYVYKAYFNEIEYAYRTKAYCNFVKAVMSLMTNKSFYIMLGELQSSSVGHFAKMLRFLIDMRLKRTFGWALWLMEYRSLGRVKRK